MTAITWHPVGEVDPRGLGEARLQAHNVVQWLARMVHSYCPREPGEGHLRLLWLSDRQAVVTREVRPGLVLELRFPRLSMVFVENGRPVPHEIDIRERSPAQVEAWFLVELLHRGLDRDRFSKVLPYEIAGLMTGDAADYLEVPCEAELDELAAWLGNAGAIFGDLVRDSGGASPGAVECWPQNLHMTARLGEGNGVARREGEIRVGFAPGDARDPEPYFYVTTEREWTRGERPPGAVLPASEILAGGGRDEVMRFLREAISRARAERAD